MAKSSHKCSQYLPSFAQLDNVLVNSDATVESLMSKPSIQACGHYRNAFLKPSEIFIFLVILLAKRLTKENFCIKFASQWFILVLGHHQMAKEILLNLFI